MKDTDISKSQVVANRYSPLLGVICVAVLVLIAFGRSLTQGFAPVDDDLLVTHNLAIRGITAENLHAVFTTFDPELYIPLTFVSYQIDYLIGGLHPFFYHLTNILLHTGNALLAGWLLMFLTKKPALSFFAAAIFAVHPLNTEAVAWLAGRKDLLSTFFMLLSFISYLKYKERRGGSRAARPYALSIIFLLLALLSKVMAMTVPALFLLYDILIEKRRWGWRMLVEKIPHIALSSVFLGIAMLGKERIIAQHSMWETALMAAKSTTFYLQKFLLPTGLGVFHPYRGDIGILLPAFLIPALIIAAIAAATAWSLRKEKRLAFGVLFFFITLAPTFINFHKGGEMYFASDRYPYFPMIGLFCLLVMALARVSVPRHVPWAGALACIAVLAGLSFQQTKIWDSAQTLFGNTLRQYPQSVAARVALASIARQTGKYEQAIKLLREGIAYGDDLRLRMGLGTVYAKQGRVGDAAEQFAKAKEMEPENPEPYVALGVLDEHANNIDAALANYRKAVEMDPSYVSARNKLGTILLEAGKTAEAEEQFRAALAWNPNAEGVLFNLAMILIERGEKAEARTLLEDAHALSPEDRTIAEALKDL